MTKRKTRVLVVDDSPLIREILSDILTESPETEVVGTAGDGNEALTQYERLKPDVVTLDVQMPKMDGLETLDQLLKRHSAAVIMISALTDLGGDTTLDALDRGALDYIAKPQGLKEARTTLQDELLRKIRAATGIDVNKVLEARRKRAAKRAERRALRQQKTEDAGVSHPFRDKLIALGISTGGPPALAATFEALHGPLPPIVIVQHMPATFTGQFAQRLNDLSELAVKEAATGDILLPNHAYVAPGGKHLSIRPAANGSKLLVRDGENVSGHKPSVDVMMKSAANIYGDRCLGIIMTGMGRDGSDGCKAIRSAGGFVLGQDEESSDVYGMNKVAQREGNVDRQFGLDEAAGTITLQVKRMWGAVRA